MAKLLSLIAILAVLILNHYSVNAGYHYVVNRWFMQGFSETPYSECGGSSVLNKIEVIPCDNDDTCDLKTGSSATINIGFTPKSDASQVSALVHGVVAGIPMPFHFPQANACQNSNITCPLKAGKNYFYSVQLPVLASYPKIKVMVKWQLKDQGGRDIVCVEIPARLT